MTPFRHFVARLVRTVVLSELTRHLEFEVSNVPRFGFVPGQWLSFTRETPDGEDITRPYSIASPPSDDNRFALCLNRVQDGFMSNYLCGMKEGAEISFEGPFGNLTLHPPPRDTIFTATGTGIAPFRSMLHWLLADASRHQGHQFWLVFGSRDERDLYYHGEFLRLAAEHDVAYPLRAVLSSQRNTTVILAEATGVAVATRRVVLADGWLTYDYLIIAPGARHSYFAHPEWEEYAPGLKTVEDALAIRRRVLLAFERYDIHQGSL